MSAAEAQTLLFSARGTGQTTGHIAVIAVTNNGTNNIEVVDTGKPGLQKIALFDSRTKAVWSLLGDRGDYNGEDLEIGGEWAYIPADQGHQGYIATAVGWPPGITAASSNSDASGLTVVRTVNPGESVLLPVSGYCTDIRRPPVPPGESTIPVSEWVTSSEAAIPEASSFAELEIIRSQFDPELGPRIANIPAVVGLNPDETLIMSIDPRTSKYIDNYAHDVALSAFLFDALRKISAAVDILQAANSIITPFSSDSLKERERETVIQQTLWLYTSVLKGDPYTIEDFRTRMIAQFEDNTGQDLEDAPPTVQDELESGVDDFWNSFELVGSAAKVLSYDNDWEMQGNLPPDVLDEIEDALGKIDTTEVGAHTGEASDNANEGMGAKAYEKGDAVVKGAKPNPNDAADEVMHAAQDSHKNAGDGVPPLDRAERPEDLNAENIIEYMKYRKLREEQGLPHLAACADLGIDSNSELALALERIYENDLSE